jgi:hypothetical protein
MSKTKEYDFNALLLVASRQDAIADSMLDMWGRRYECVLNGEGIGQGVTRSSSGFTTIARR